MSHRSGSLFENAPFTTLCIGGCIAFYVFLTIVASRQPSGQGSLFGGIPGDVLIQCGASWREGVWDGGWQRFVLPMFMHASLLHIALNLYSLYQMGPSVEVHFGSSNFGTIYVVSGVGGICCSLLLGGHVSVGASTCLFGILGAYLAAKVFACWDWRRAVKNRDVRQTAFWIALNYALVGLAFPQVDNWGHLGGLILGFVYGGLFEYWRKHHRVGLALILSIVLLTAAGVVACRWMVFSPHYHVHLALRADAEGRAEEAQRQFEEARDWAKVRRSEAAGWELYEAAFRAEEAGDYARRDALVRIMEDVAPASFLREVLGMR